MMLSDDEKTQVQELDQKEINKMVSKRLSALEEKVVVIEERQGEQEEELRGLKYDHRVFRDYMVEDQRGWRMVKTAGVVFCVGWVLMIIWVVLK